MSSTFQTYSSSFAWRRVHSLLGLFLVLFLTEHLLTNSQAALLLGENGAGFVRAVNFLKNLPYLPVLEVVLIGIPILFHGALGIKYALSGSVNALPTDGSAPSLKQYGRNHAYTWQRITSWILLFGIIFHVGYLRFYKYPASTPIGLSHLYVTRISMDDGLYSVSEKLGVTLVTQQDIQKERFEIANLERTQKALFAKAESLFSYSASVDSSYQEGLQEAAVAYQQYLDRKNILAAYERKTLSEGQVLAASSSFGAVTLLNVRDSFKTIWICIAYTIFVLAAAFHGFNGLWTFLITWGAVLRVSSQKKATQWCIGFMTVILFLGLASIWGTFWLNIRF